MRNYLKRIILDIRDITKSPIDNIFYFPNEDNICKGTALIIGPKDTPYQYGFYIFDFTFPDSYPHGPPVVKYRTNDGNTRFNPNFYRNGKVCLSILNTWDGEPWSSCQSLRSILITLQITMNEKPLLNEPGVHEIYHASRVEQYNDIIEFKNIETSILYIMKCVENPESPYHCFNDIVKEKFRENYDAIMQFVENKRNNVFQTRTTYERATIYKMTGLIDYGALYLMLTEKIRNI